MVTLEPILRHFTTALTLEDRATMKQLLNLPFYIHKNTSLNTTMALIYNRLAI